jgi:hypothetical protein
MGIVLELSEGILESIATEGRLTAGQSRQVFEKVLDVHVGTDKKIVAAAIYNFFTAPLQRPKTFGPPVQLPG